MRVPIRPACLVAAVMLAALVGGATASTAPLPALQPVALPRDHGAHPSFQVEWWYTAGTVADHRGRNFFWFATLWAGEGFVVARVNVVDLQADRQEEDGREQSRQPGAAGCRYQPGRD